MQKFVRVYLLLLGCLFLVNNAIVAAPNAPKPEKKEASTKEAVSAEEYWDQLSKKEKRAKKKELKKELKSTLKAAKKQNNTSDIDLTLLVILAILIPPLAMGIYDGITNRFWLSLLLTLLFFLPGMIYTLVVILREN